MEQTDSWQSPDFGQDSQSWLFADKTEKLYDTDNDWLNSPSVLSGAVYLSANDLDFLHKQLEPTVQNPTASKSYAALVSSGDLDAARARLLPPSDVATDVIDSVEDEQKSVDDAIEKLVTIPVDEIISAVTGAPPTGDNNSKLLWASKRAAVSYLSRVWGAIKHKVQFHAIVGTLSYAGTNAMVNALGVGKSINFGTAMGMAFGAAGVTASLFTQSVDIGLNMLWVSALWGIKVGGIDLASRLIKGLSPDIREFVERPVLSASTRSLLSKVGLPVWMYAMTREHLFLYLAQLLKTYIMYAGPSGPFSWEAVHNFNASLAFNLFASGVMAVPGAVALAGSGIVNGIAAHYSRLRDDDWINPPSDAKPPTDDDVAAYANMKNRLKVAVGAVRAESKRGFGEQADGPREAALLEAISKIGLSSPMKKWKDENPTEQFVPDSVIEAAIKDFEPKLLQVLMEHTNASVERVDEILRAQPGMEQLQREVIEPITTPPQLRTASESHLARLSSTIFNARNIAAATLIGSVLGLTVCMEMTGSSQEGFAMATELLGKAAPSFMASPYVEGVKRAISALLPSRTVFYLFTAGYLGTSTMFQRLTDWVAVDRIRTAKLLDVEIRALSPSNPRRWKLIGTLVDAIVPRYRSDEQLQSLTRAQLILAWRERESIPADVEKLINQTTDDDIRSRVKALQTGHTRVLIASFLSLGVKLAAAGGVGAFTQYALSEQAARYRSNAYDFVRDNGKALAQGISATQARCLDNVLTYMPTNWNVVHLLANGKLPDLQTIPELANNEVYAEALRAAGKLPSPLSVQEVPTLAAESAEETAKVQFNPLTQSPLPKLQDVLKHGITPVPKPELFTLEEREERATWAILEATFGPKAIEVARKLNFVPPVDSAIIAFNKAKFAAVVDIGTNGAPVETFAQALNEMSEKAETLGQVMAFAKETVKYQYGSGVEGKGLRLAQPKTVCIAAGTSGLVQCEKVEYETPLHEWIPTFDYKHKPVSAAGVLGTMNAEALQFMMQFEKNFAKELFAAVLANPTASARELVLDVFKRNFVGKIVPGAWQFLTRDLPLNKAISAINDHVSDKASTDGKIGFFKRFIWDSSSDQEKITMVKSPEFAPPSAQISLTDREKNRETIVAILEQKVFELSSRAVSPEKPANPIFDASRVGPPQSSLPTPLEPYQAPDGRFYQRRFYEGKIQQRDLNQGRRADPPVNTWYDTDKQKQVYIQVAERDLERARQELDWYISTGQPVALAQATGDRIRELEQRIITLSETPKLISENPQQRRRRSPPSKEACNQCGLRMKPKYWARSAQTGQVRAFCSRGCMETYLRP